MARSVDYLNKAIRVNYFTLPDMEDGLEEFQYQDLVESITETFKSQFPEFEYQKHKFEGREVRIILQGYGVQVGLSEYGSLWSLSVSAIEDDYTTDEDVEMAREWVEKNWDDVSKYWSEYRKVGTFSNGEGVYELINQKPQDNGK